MTNLFHFIAAFRGRQDRFVVPICPIDFRFEQRNSEWMSSVHNDLCSSSTIQIAALDFVFERIDPVEFA